MTMLRFLIFLGFIFSCFLIWWLYKNVPLFGLVQEIDGQWQVVALGWETFSYSSIFLGFSIAIGLVFYNLISSISEYIDRNYKKEIEEKYRSHFEQYFKEKYDHYVEYHENDIEYTKALIKNRQAELREEHRQMLIREEKVEFDRKKLERQQNDAEEKYQKYSNLLSKLEKKKRNAMGAAERIKRREAKNKGL